MKLVPTEEEIDQQMNQAAESADAGRSRWPGMTYEEGALAALGWATGLSDQPPLQDD